MFSTMLVMGETVVTTLIAPLLSERADASAVLLASLPSVDEEPQASVADNIKERKMTPNQPNLAVDICCSNVPGSRKII